MLLEVGLGTVAIASTIGILNILKNDNSIDGDNEIEIDNIIRYEYIPTESFDMYRKDNVIKYEFVEGLKDGVSAYIGNDLDGNKVKINMLDGSLLIGGMTGGGKSNILNVLLTSLMLTYTKNEVCFIGCDLASSDVYYFGRYKNFIGMSNTHKLFLDQVEWLEEKFKQRSKILNDANCRNAISYNAKNEVKMPYIVFVIDEVVLLTTNSKCKDKLHELMCVARKYGCYFILCLQDATKDTIGRCKMNCTQIIGLKTFDETDSNTIIGKGCDLQDIKVAGRCKIRNKNGVEEVQSYYISEEQIEAYLKPFEKDNSINV